MNDNREVRGAWPLAAVRPARIPVNMGTLHMYSNVEPWRSIFDKDNAERIVAYSGDCKEADDRYARERAGAH